LEDWRIGAGKNIWQENRTKMSRMGEKCHFIGLKNCGANINVSADNIDKEIMNSNKGKLAFEFGK
jgi:hypothetical protein